MEKELIAKDQEKASALAAKGQLEFDLKTKNEEIKRLNTVCNLSTILLSVILRSLLWNAALFSYL